MSADEEKGWAPMATVASLHTAQKAALARQSDINDRVLARLGELSEQLIRTDARLDVGAKTFEALREKIADLKPTPVPWTQKLAVGVGVIGLVGAAFVAMARAPSRDDFEALRTSILQIQLEQVRVRADLDLARQPRSTP